MQQLINKVNEAKAVLNVSQSKLSTMIGYSQNYISESIHRNCSAQKQQYIIDLIDRVMAGEVIPSQDELLMHELTRKCIQTGLELDKQRNSAIHFKECYFEMQKAVGQLNKELRSQKFNTNFYFFLALALGILLGVVFS